MDTGATRVIPRIDADGPYSDGGYAPYGGGGGYGDGLAETAATPVVGPQRGHSDADGTRLLPHMRTAPNAFDDPAYDYLFADGTRGNGDPDDTYASTRPTGTTTPTGTATTVTTARNRPPAAVPHAAATTPPGTPTTPAAG
jgi:hypothetical protein